MLLDATLDAREGRSDINHMTGGRSGKRRLRGMRVLVVEDKPHQSASGRGAIGRRGGHCFPSRQNGRLGVEAVCCSRATV